MIFCGYNPKKLYYFVVTTLKNHNKMQLEPKNFIWRYTTI